MLFRILAIVSLFVLGCNAIHADPITAGFNIPATLGKTIPQLKRMMRGHSGYSAVVNPTDSGDFQGDTELSWNWIGHKGTIVMEIDRHTRRCVFCQVVNQEDMGAGLGIPMDNWRAALSRFGISPDEEPDTQKMAYLEWHSYHGNRFIHIYSTTDTGNVWSVEEALTGLQYSAETGVVY